MIVTDLDGTLLDHDTYACDAGRAGLDLLARRGVPVILSSSKTRAEIAAIQRELELRHPCISENGGGLFIPDDYFAFLPGIVRRVQGGVALEFGSPYRDVVAALHWAATRLHIQVAGFSDMSAEDIAALCNLSVAQARLAKLREYDEPFRIVRSVPSARSRLRAALRARGFGYTRGGRFDHVTGGTDKGVALAALANPVSAQRRKPRADRRAWRQPQRPAAARQRRHPDRGPQPRQRLLRAPDRAAALRAGDPAGRRRRLD